MVSNRRGPWTPETRDVLQYALSAVWGFRLCQFLGIGGSWTSGNLTHTTKQNASVFYKAIVLLPKLKSSWLFRAEA
ncbi:hypothetical protein SFRURICE_002681 [Spodoptera frugiperda]|nr:hypothetical protein SFRURICE_002681 [Spodoptera frugiperda]